MKYLIKSPIKMAVPPGINGAPVATTTTLLDQLDKAVSSEGFTFNSCVYKRGLKIMVLEDIKHSRWCALATTTCSEIERNLKQFNDGEKDNDPAAFQYMMLSQAVQRLIKGASSKLKMKDRVSTSKKQDKNMMFAQYCYYMFKLVYNHTRLTSLTCHS